MSRTTRMATGFFLIFMGVQLHIVESFTLTPRVAHFLHDNFSQDPAAVVPVIATQTQPALINGRQNYQSPYYQASYDNSASVPVIQAASQSQTRTVSRRLQLPRWICWPILFLGAFLIIQSATGARRE